MTAKPTKTHFQFSRDDIVTPSAYTTQADDTDTKMRSLADAVLVLEVTKGGVSLFDDDFKMVM